MKRFQFKQILVCSVGLAVVVAFSFFGVAVQAQGVEEAVVVEVEVQAMPAEVIPAAKLTPAKAVATDEKAVAEAVKRAADYLRAHQAEDGSFSSMMGSGVTSIALIGLLQNGYTAEDPMVAKALAYLESKVQADGAIFDEKLGFGNYETSVAVLAFVLANKADGKGKYDALLKNAEQYLRKYQWDESEGLDPSDVKYGGAGYGGGRMSRPDLSNTAFLMDALVALGADKNGDAVKKALVFVSRCQNLESQHNTLPFAAENPDGGFIYTPLDADKTDEAGNKVPLKAYGSMSYAGFKSLIYAGLTENSTRGKAVLKWLTEHYSVTENPGQGQAGLYYYYIAMSKALKVYGKDTFPGADGKAHDWRAELTAEILVDQQEDGSWVNDKSSRWMENDANLVTAYALQVLANCKK